jgi:hypothetical protein
MSALTCVSDKQFENSLTSNDTITLTSSTGDKWVGEVVYDCGYEFSCHHCGTEMAETDGYSINNDRYCSDCACVLFDEPEPISAYDIWREEQDEQKRQEAERRRVKEERDCQYMKELEEELERYRMSEAENDVLIIKNSKCEFECCHCETEMAETDGYSINNHRYCSDCACALEEQEYARSSREFYYYYH